MFSQSLPNSVGAAARGAGNVDSRPFGNAVWAGFLAWVIITLGFAGLHLLMQQRPQFVGQPLAASKVTLIQDAPQIVMRKVTDDISVVRPISPDSSDVHFDLAGHRDYRGLKTISDMSGQVRADYVVTNELDDPIFVLFRAPHPHADTRSGQGLVASALRLQASGPGLQENIDDAWLWSGTIAPRSSVTVGIRYEVGSLRGVSYRVTDSAGYPVKRLRVTLQRQDLDTMQFESGDGASVNPGATVVWERTDFLPPDYFSAQLVEGRNLFTALSQLLEIGPLVTLLFLLATLAAILSELSLTPVQVLTLSAGYALYFPLILYLSTRFAFLTALVCAVLIPGILVVNYSRWLLGPRAGLFGAVLFLGLYQVFPTLAAFVGWNRGMVLLALGVVTLAVLIHLQNQALRRGSVAVATAALAVFLGLPPRAQAADALIAFEPAQYHVQHELTHVRVDVKVPFQVLRAGDMPVALFEGAVHVMNSTQPAPGLARLVTVTNRLSLFAEKPGAGTVELSYRAPVLNHEGKQRVEIPMLLGATGNIQVQSPRGDLDVLGGSLWSKSSAGPLVTYEIGVAGAPQLVLEWQEHGGGAPAAVEGANEIYGIGVARAQHLTVIHSDGTCAHFAEFEVPATSAQEFRMRLPDGVHLISALLNGTEINAPLVEDQVCRLHLPGRATLQTTHRLSFRLAYPPERLGFVGVAQFALPELQQTVGTLEWVIALPTGFQAQVISSGLEAQSAAPDLSRFGDYGRIVKAQPQTFLAKNLAPPGPVTLNLKYRQSLSGVFAGK